MRFVPVLLLMAACADDPAVAQIMHVTTPEFTLQPGEEKFYCYFTSLPSADSGIRRVASSMTPGSHHMIVFKTKEAGQPDGTFGECDGFGGMDGGSGGIPVWLYASQTPEGELVLPDGVGLALDKDQPIFVNMHYVNIGEEPITAHVDLELETLPPGTTYDEARGYITYNTEIDIAPGQIGTAGGSCDVDPEAKFLMMSTHSHQYTMTATVRNGDATVLETNDWAHATVARWDAPYFQFTTGKLEYECMYRNTTNIPLTTGESALANEMCMAVGLMFPATGDTFCLNNNAFTL
jgi:hypothetical protein